MNNNNNNDCSSSASVVPMLCSSEASEPSPFPSPPRRSYSSDGTTNAVTTPSTSSSGSEELHAAAVLVSLPSTQITDKQQQQPILSAPSCITMDTTTTSSYRLECRPLSPLRTSHCATSTVAEHMTISRVPSNESGDHTQQQQESPSFYYNGNISLYIPQGDDDVLSPLHCFMRLYCVEAFSATQEDVEKNHSIVLGQVGIRCLHCRHVPVPPERAVSYPSTLRNIYHSIETWQRRHSIRCDYIPGWIKRELTSLLEQSRTGAGGRRQYWEDSAKRLGLVDTPDGIRFARDPATLEPANTVSAAIHQAPQDYHQQQTTPTSRSPPLVQEADKPLVGEFLYLLILQVEPCSFTEEDRAGGRSKVKDCPVGFPGMQCIHCQGKAGYGRYFPSSVEALALANSDRNIYNHVRKCRRCPNAIRQHLEILHTKHTKRAGKNKRGSRKQFFSRIWQRIHHSNSSGDSSCCSPVHVVPV